MRARTLVVTCAGRLSETSLEEIVHQVVDAVDCRVIMIDLHRVTQMDNDTLCQLCVTLRGFDGARLRVSGADGRVRRVLTLCAIEGLELGPPIAPSPVRRLLGGVRSLTPRWRRTPARQLDLEGVPSRPLS